MDSSVVTEESVFVKIEPVWSEDFSGVSGIIPDIDNMKIENTKSENLMDISSERSNPIIKEEIANYHPVTEIVHDIKTLEEDGKEDVKIETHDEMCHTLVETQEVERSALLPGTMVYTCDNCSKTFSRKKYLTIHMLTHTGIRRYRCTICNFTFIQQSHLNNHLISHSTRRPHKCLICTRSFKRAYDLRSHSLIHTDKKPFRCSLCENSFRSLSSVRRHEKTHSKGRPFCCNNCGNSFKSLRYLREHEKIHGDLHPYHCSFCTSSFKTASHLRTHVKNKH